MPNFFLSSFFVLEILEDQVTIFEEGLFYDWQWERNLSNSLIVESNFRKKKRFRST